MATKRLEVPATVDINALDARLRKIEQAVGQIAVAISDPSRSDSFTERLLQVQKTLGHLYQQDIGRLARRQKRAEHLVASAADASAPALDDVGQDAKREIVLASESSITKSADDLSKIDLAVDAASSPKGVGAARSKLAPLQAEHLAQMSDAELASLDTQSALEAYNNNVITITKVFAMWEKLLIKMEKQVDDLLKLRDGK